MKPYLVAALLFVPAQMLPAQVSQAGSPERDRALVERARARQEEIADVLDPQLKRRLHNSALGMVERLRQGNYDQDFAEIARIEVRQKVAKTKPAQSELLAAYILAETVRVLVQPADERHDSSEVAALSGQSPDGALTRQSPFAVAVAKMLQRTDTLSPEILRALK